MPDREKVKQGIKACWSEYFSHKCYDCPYKDIRDENECVEKLGKDILTLLKEQDGIIKALESDLDDCKAVIAERSNVVRCKDCRKRVTVNCWMYFFGRRTPDDYFCADGERKT